MTQHARVRTTMKTLLVLLLGLMLPFHWPEAKEIIGFTPSRDLEPAIQTAPRGVFRGREMRAYHAFSPGARTRGIWSFVTGPIRKVVQSRESIFTTANPAPEGKYQIEGVVVFEDFSTAAIEFSNTEWARISYEGRNYYTPKTHLLAKKIAK